ncbi:glycosyltransferase [Peribacillus deserti]|uniref:Glycosyl transferase n=1 Tax=Peribacillus deserti TaxID=673318 RepID=A0A2N5MBR7_9BACI|nr:glycosyltransferase [Peribacillus deserti]PLT31787.1 glycosyl transferase [Peribacillus deserti]
MRVLQINSVCGVGSTGRIATDIHAILIGQDHESYIAYGRNNPLNCDHAIRIGNKIDNYIHVAKTRIFDQHGFGSREATKKFINKLNELNPDVIHLHNIHGYYINVEILFEYLKEANKPVVWTLHDCWAFTGHCAHFDYTGCDCWKVEGNHKCIQKRSYPSSFLVNNSPSNYKRKSKAFTGINNLTIVTPSLWLANLVKKSFLKNYRVKIINNGVDLSVFKPVKSGLRKRYKIEDKFLILGVANVWTEKKGFNHFIQLSKKLENNEVIVLVGVTERQKKYLPENIIGINKTNSIQELAEIYSHADVYVNLTLEEVMGLTNIEALACGTPVITFDSGGSVECIDSKTGIVVEKGNQIKLFEEIRKIKNEKVKFHKESTIERAKSMYDKTILYNQYLDLYQNVLEGNIE